MFHDMFVYGPDLDGGQTWTGTGHERYEISQQHTLTLLGTRESSLNHRISNRQTACLTDPSDEFPITTDLLSPWLGL